MNYKQKYYEEIFNKMLETSLENGLISHAEEFPSYIANRQDISNYYVMDKSVIAEMFSIVYEDITNVYNSININIATGKDLDNLGDLLGVIRPSATYAMVEATFTARGIEDTYTLDEGIILETSNNIRYRTLEPLTFAPNNLESTVECIAVHPGAGSKIGAGTLTNIITETTIQLTVTNNNGSSGGKEAYTDDEYRELLQAWRLIYLKGSLEAYENYFANLDGIDGYKLIPNWNGTGTLKVVLDPGTPYLLNQVYTDLEETISQATEDITMFAPLEKTIDIYAIVNVDIDQLNPYSDTEKADIQSKIISAIRVFIDGGYRNNNTYYPGLSIGEDFIPHKLAVFLDEEINELKDINFNYPVEYIQILDEEQGKSNEITIEMI